MMGNSDEKTRVVATCDSCGSVYASIELSNNGLQPIGSRAGCASCGGTEFTAVSDAPTGGQPVGDGDDAASALE